MVARPLPHTISIFVSRPRPGSPFATPPTPRETSKRDTTKEKHLLALRRAEQRLEACQTGRRSE